MPHKNKKAGFVTIGKEELPVYECQEHKELFCPDNGEFCIQCFERDTKEEWSREAEERYLELQAQEDVFWEYWS